MKEEIRCELLASGLDLVGFASTRENDIDVKHFQEWLDNDYNARMEWLQRSLDKRIDPEKILASVKTIIVCGVNYYYPLKRNKDSAWIANYAVGTDYHLVIKNILVKTWQQIRREKKIEDEFRVYVDTGPVYEKYWAQKAGLGWIGKNGCVISPELGSYFLIGTILTSAEFLPDNEHPNHCGRCKSCLDACPTGALVSPYVIDARKCISYLTIEHRGDLPVSLRAQFGKWIFGCDLCQEVCPWNKKHAQPTRTPDFQPRWNNMNKPIKFWKNINESEFRERFRKSPIKRLSHKRFLRNVQFIAADTNVRYSPDEK